MSAKSFLYLYGRDSAGFPCRKLSYTEERGKNNGIDRIDKQCGERMGVGAAYAGLDGICGDSDDRSDGRFSDSAYWPLDEKNNRRYL